VTLRPGPVPGETAPPPAGRAPEPPPPLGSWGRLYAIVLGALALELVLLGWLTERYR
jgi:hypothetical protein